MLCPPPAQRTFPRSPRPSRSDRSLPPFPSSPRSPADRNPDRRADGLCLPPVRNSGRGNDTRSSEASASATLRHTETATLGGRGGHAHRGVDAQGDQRRPASAGQYLHGDPHPTGAAVPGRAHQRPPAAAAAAAAACLEPPLPWGLPSLSRPSVC
uniref:Predicted protein n=1 Tax=Hordeum vulgare subsp. vulgare TaxID=112509 RepID=F2E7G4_HORVV|nr:predicted protein [Hordeum vulgare subsp. vulgare]